ncbi:MAG: pyridoxal phosphate-dependent aminotransferase, partial [Oscillibacter sp.]|nr:pyridoxal phosphate-dependent aminotransferase [Oscillibacter sp.]
MRFSQKIERCHLSPIRKFAPAEAAAQAQGKKIYSLNIGQPDVATPPEFFEGAFSFREPVLKYALSTGLPEYLDSVIGYYKTIGVTLTRDDMLATTGGSEALQFAMECILDDGDEVLIPEPFYANYNTFALVTGGRVRPIPTNPEEGYRYADRARIEPLITERTRAILVTNPGNPTGVILSREEMRLLADIAKEHGLFLVVDEVYREFTYEGQPCASFGEFEDVAENVILIDSISKRFSACGARVGVLISRNHDLITHALKLCQSRLCCATIDQLGAAALYRYASPAYFEAIREEYKKRRDTVVAELRKIPGVRCRTPDGAFYMMVTLPVDDTESLQHFLLEEFSDNGETVMYAPGSGFYADPEDGRCEVRIAY